MITNNQIKLINKSYIDTQLNNIDVTACQSLKLTDANGGRTNFIGLNDSISIEILISYLRERQNFLNEKLAALVAKHEAETFNAEKYFTTVIKAYSGANDEN